MEKSKTIQLLSKTLQLLAALWFVAAVNFISAWCLHTQQERLLRQATGFRKGDYVGLVTNAGSNKVAIYRAWP